MQYAGFPILNDINYGGRDVGNFYGKYTFGHLNKKNEDKITENEEPNPEKNEIAQKNDVDLVKRENKDETTANQEVEDMLHYYRFDGTKLMEIFLHAKQYTFEQRVFETDDPYWAKQNFDF